MAYNPYTGKWEMDPAQQEQMRPMQRAPVPQYPMQPQKHEILWVTGVQGAKQLEMGPDDAMLALDNAAAILYFIKTDSAAYKTVTAFDLLPHMTEEEKQQQSMAEQMDRIMQKLTELEEKINAKSNYATDGSGKRQQRKQSVERADADGEADAERAEPADDSELSGRAAGL